jgi:hypothetical protein
VECEAWLTILREDQLGKKKDAVGYIRREKRCLAIAGTFVKSYT